MRPASRSAANSPVSEEKGAVRVQQRNGHDDAALPTATDTARADDDLARLVLEHQ